MGYQSSRIVWGKTKRDPDDEGFNEVPVTDMEKDVIYTSGNMIIYAREGFMKTDPKAYQCVVEESCNRDPLRYPEDWKEIPGVPVIEVKVIPGAPSYVIEKINSKRMTFTPGARVIFKNSEDGHHYLYRCIFKTNVYYDGFDNRKWAIIKHNPGIVYIPKDHKDVYYNDGRNENKWHRAMYYVPDEPWESEEEITYFNEYTSYQKGEIVLYRNYGDFDRHEDETDPESPIIYTAKWATAFRYIYGVPSTPTRESEEGYIEYTQPSPHSTTYWEKCEDINVFSTFKSYKKGDKVVWDLFENEESSGYYDAVVSVFNSNYTYKRGQYCLYRIKPYEGHDISEKDCLALKTTGDYDMKPLEPPYWMEEVPTPTSEYGRLIQSGAEIYGLYEYTGSDQKPKGYEFVNSQWTLIPRVKMFSENLDKYREGYNAGDYTIAATNGTFALFKALSDREPDYYVTQEMYDKYGEDAMCYGYCIKTLHMGYFWIGFPAAPSDVERDSRVKSVWQIVTQRMKDPVVGYKVYMAVKNIGYASTFKRQEWQIVTQKKLTIEEDYGYIWKKFGYGAGGGVPFGADFPITTTDFNSKVFKARFNGLTLYRGNNTLELGEVITTNTANGYMSDYYAYTVGTTGWYGIYGFGGYTISSNVLSFDIFFIRDTFKRRWNMYKMSTILEESGLVKTAILPCLCTWPNGIITFFYGKFKRDLQDRITADFYKLTLLDYSNKRYSLVKTKTIVANTSIYNKYSLMKGYTNSFLSPGFGETGSVGVNDLSDGLLYVPYISGINADSPIVYSNRKITQYYNQDGDVVYTAIGDFDWIISQGSYDEYAVIDNLSEFYRNFDPLIPYLLNILTNESSESSELAYNWYFHFTDGYVGDLNTELTETYCNRWRQLTDLALQSAGAHGVNTKISEVEVSGYYDGHPYDKLVGYSLMGRYPRPYYAYMKGTDEFHNLPERGGNRTWITHDPIFGSYTFRSQDGTKLHQLKWAYGFFGSDLKFSTEDYSTMGYLSIVVLVTVDLASGITTKSPIIRQFDQGFAYYDSDTGEWKAFTSVNDKTIITTYKTSALERLNVVYWDQYQIIIINSTYNYYSDTQEAKVSASTGLWVISYMPYSIGEGISKGDYTFMPIYAFTDSIQALFRLCIIEKIPYYGNQTAHLSGMDRDIKYLYLNFGGLAMDQDVPYIANKWEEMNADNSIYMSVSLASWQNSPTTACATDSLVTNSDDIVYSRSVDIKSKDGTRTKKYIINVVLPRFKSIFSNCYKTLRYGSAYDPIVSGAFFWLTSDDFLYDVDPQYGGPEGGAEGFSGW